MSLKDYQIRIVGEVHKYLRALSKQRAGGNVRHGSSDAWEDIGIRGRYTEEKNGLGEDLPRFCVKVPTGGGKTLLATQMLGSAMQTILADRNGAGLVLWVVPSSQIYRDTMKQLRERGGFLRTMLEHAVSRKVEVWQKTDIARMTPAQHRECLNILMLQLASTNRQTKEQLKFFKDSGGNIVQHFPPEDDPAAHKALKQQTPNLDMIEDDEDSGRHLAATSVGNLVKLCRPAVVLDEGHKATSELAQKTIRDFNASIVMELSATPRREANILARATGDDLLKEEMIKLPLNIAVSGARSWKDVLTRTRDKRAALAKRADGLILGGKWTKAIRPIVLVQVERTGKDQRDSDHIHAEDVKDELLRLGVHEQAIAIKTSDKDDIEGIDLMDPDCPVCWIITKAALQEGWDCPFAYILASLDNTGSKTAMTQLIGRVLRQPYQAQTPVPALNQSYVYCLRASAMEVSRQVKKALENEGYEGDLEAMVVNTGGDDKAPVREARIRGEFLKPYREPFEGKIYLPHFCVKQGKQYEALDYFRHLVATVDVDKFDYKGIPWKLSDELAKAKDRFYSVTIGQEVKKEYETQADLLETDGQVLAWLAAGLPFDYLSFKQLRLIVHRVYEHLCATELDLKDHFDLVKFAVRERLERFVEEQVNLQTKQAFEKLFKQGKLCFYLECTQCRFEIPNSIEVKSKKQMVREDNSPIAKSLFDYVDEEAQNEYERAVALCLDHDTNVLWWYRNLVGAENFAIQGYRRHKVRPDFVVKRVDDGHEYHDVLVVESKGRHLKGNEDTLYKKSVAGYFEKVGKRVTWQRLGEDFKDHQFRFQVLDEAHDLGEDWRGELKSLLAASL